MPLNDNARTLGLMGAKGGVGTTVLASSLAWALAQRGLRVVMLDLDRRSGQAALHLCERNAGPTLREALQVVERMDDTLLDTLLTPCATNLRLLPAPRAWMPAGAETATGGAQLLRLVQVARELADCVLLDLPSTAMADEAFTALLREVDELVLVSEPTLPATFNARRAWQWLLDERHDQHERRERREGHGTAHAGCTLALNKVHRQHALSPDQVWRTLGLDTSMTARLELPRSDAAVASATYQGKALGALDGREPLARAVGQWADDLVAQWEARWEAQSEAQRETPLQTQNGQGPADDPDGRRNGPDDAPSAVTTPGLASWRERLQRWAI